MTTLRTKIASILAMTFKFRILVVFSEHDTRLVTFSNNVVDKDYDALLQSLVKFVCQTYSSEIQPLLRLTFNYPSWTKFKRPGGWGCENEMSKVTSINITRGCELKTAVDLAKECHLDAYRNDMIELIAHVKRVDHSWEDTDSTSAEGGDTGSLDLWLRAKEDKPTTSAIVSPPQAPVVSQAGSTDCKTSQVTTAQVTPSSKEPNTGQFGLARFKKKHICYLALFLALLWSILTVTSFVFYAVHNPTASYAWRTQSVSGVPSSSFVRDRPTPPMVQQTVQHQQHRVASTFLPTPTSTPTSSSCPPRATIF